MGSGIQYVAKFLIIFGLITILIGVVLLLFGKIPWFGKLPGDIIIQRRNFTFYFPLATSIILSIALTLIFWFLGRK